MAYISFLIALHYYYPASPSTSLPSSLYKVIQAAGLKLHPKWLHDLEASPVTQFRSDPQWVGCIVDVKSCKWLNLVPVMITAKVPIWLFWGQSPFLTSNDSQISWTSFYAPAINEPAHSALPVKSAPLVATKSPASSSFPPVRLGSGQLPGESMRAYFQRRKERHGTYKQNESLKKYIYICCGANEGQNSLPLKWASEANLRRAKPRAKLWTLYGSGGHFSRQFLWVWQQMRLCESVENCLSYLHAAPCVSQIG